MLRCSPHVFSAVPMMEVVDCFLSCRGKVEVILELWRGAPSMPRNPRQHPLPLQSSKQHQIELRLPFGVRGRMITIC